MEAVAPEVVQDVGVIAAGFLQGVSQDRQAVERPVFIDRSGQADDGGREPGRGLRSPAGRGFRRRPEVSATTRRSRPFHPAPAIPRWMIPSEYVGETQAGQYRTYGSAETFGLYLVMLEVKFLRW